MGDFSKLRGRIREVFGTERDFAVKLGLSGTSLSKKLNGRVDFSRNEIAQTLSILNIPPDQISDYFFTE